MTYPIGPAALPDSAQAIAGAIPDSASVRIGIVKAQDAGVITVAISGSDALVGAAYLFGGYRPALGEQVVVLKQGNQWVALGALSSMPEDNPVENPSFEADPPGAGVPTGWTGYNSTGTASVLTDDLLIANQIFGPQAAAVGVAEDNILHFLSSAPIAVEEGQRWTAGAMTLASLSTSAVTANVSVFLTFFADPATSYPNQVAASDIAVSTASVAPHWFHAVAASTALGVVVPGGVSHMRVTLRTFVIAPVGSSGGVFWDRVIARRLDR